MDKLLWYSMAIFCNHYSWIIPCMLRNIKPAPSEKGPKSEKGSKPRSASKAESKSKSRPSKSKTDPAEKPKAKKAKKAKDEWLIDVSIAAVLRFRFGDGHSCHLPDLGLLRQVSIYTCRFGLSSRDDAGWSRASKEQQLHISADQVLLSRVVTPHAGLDDDEENLDGAQGLVHPGSTAAWVLSFPLAGDGESSSCGDLADALLQDAEQGVSCFKSTWS